MTLPSNPPEWSGGYVGLKFLDRGRTRDGVDCWGLVRLVYAERLGVLLPDLGERYAGVDDLASIESVVADETGGGAWREVDAPGCVGDVAVYRLRGGSSHVAMAVASRRMLHSLEGTDSVIEHFDSPLWAKRLVGWYRYAGPVSVRTRRSIFAGGFAPVVHVPEGADLEAIVAGQGVDLGTPGLRVYIGDRLVPRSSWRHVRPKAGRRVTVAVVPRGGGNGKALARVLLTIAVIVAAVYLGPQVALSLGYLEAGSAAAIATAGIGLVGSLAVNTLLPAPTADLSGAGDGAGSTSPTIAGARNEVRRYAPIPVVFGRHRVVPAFGALPYTEIVGDDQYLRCLFVVGYGPLALDDLRIGETPIGEFDGVEIEIRNGYPGEDPVTIYTGSILEEGLSIVVTAADGWVLRTSERDAEELSIDFAFPRGLAVIEDSGDQSSTTVAIEIEYAPAGSGAWRSVNEESPVSARGLDLFFRSPEATLLDEGVHGETAIDWSANGVFANPPPSEITGAERLSWEIRGYIRTSVAGEYRFAVDGADAMDLELRGSRIIEHYGEHAASGPANYAAHESAAITLPVGFHAYRLRVESRNAATMAAALGWRKPGDGSYSTIPAANLFRTIELGFRTLTVPGYSYRVFDTSAYGADLVVTDNRVDLIRRSITWAVPPGQYDVRVRRVTPDATSDRVVDEVVWTAIRTIRSQNPVRVPNLAMVALRIKATDQLNGTIDQFNMIATSILPDYDADTGTWVERTTQNPAAFLRAALQGPGTAKPVGDHRLALASIEEWHTSNVSNGFLGNVVFDYAGTLFERLQQITAIGRATFAMEDGLFSVVRDRPQTTPVQHFTPRNSRGFRGRRGFPDLPHALRVRFLNEEKGYQQDEIIVYDDGFTGDNATRYETIEVYGITSSALAWRHGRFLIACGRLRPETFDLTVDVEHLACRRGDLVLVTHDVPLLGTAFGRVSQVVADTAGNAAIVEVDAALVMEDGREFGIRVRKSDGTFVFRRVVTNAGSHRTLTLDPPIPAGEPWPAAGDLFGFGDVGLDSREMIVRSIAMGPDLTATITLIDHAPAVHTSDTGPIPEYESGIVQPPEYENGPAAPIIDSVRSDDFVLLRGPDGTLVPRIVAYLRRPSASNRPTPVLIQSRFRNAEAPGGRWIYRPVMPLDGLAVDFLPVTQDVTYEIAARFVSATGQYSAWSSVEHTVIGHALPPPDVQAFDVQRLGDGTRRYTWELGTPPPDVIGVRIRFSAGADVVPWESMTDLVAGTLEGASPTDLAVPPAGTWRFGIKMVDSTGLESPNAVFVTRTLGPTPRDNVAWLEDARSKNWPGTRTNCFVSYPSNALEASGQRTWATTSSPWADWRRWNEDPFPEIQYEHPAVDMGITIDAEPSMFVDVGTDQQVAAVFDYSLDGVTWNGYAPIETFAGRTIRLRHFRAAVVVTNASAAPIPTIRDFVVTLTAPTAVEIIDNLNTATLHNPYRIGPGHFYAPISNGVFASIRTVTVTFNGTGAGWSWEVLDKSTAPGPTIRIYDPTDSPADAVVDVTITGIRLASNTE